MANDSGTYVYEQLFKIMEHKFNAQFSIRNVYAKYDTLTSGVIFILLKCARVMCM